MLTWRHLGFLVLVACTFENEVPDPADGPLTIGFEFNDSGADELSGTVMIPVVLSRPADQAVTVAYSLLDGTATRNADFTLDEGMLVFAVGEVRKEIQATIANDDDMTETAESFNIALSAPSGARLDQARAIHRVTIADHVLPRVTVSVIATMTDEGQPSQLVLSFDRPTEESSFVVIGVEGGAPAPIDASKDVTLADNSMVAIPTGVTSFSVPIGEQDDALDEDDEIAVFTLRGASTNLVLGTTRVHNHTIVDNDAPPTIGFQNMTQNIPENVVLGFTIATVRLSAESGRTVRVDYARNANDTAVDQDATVMGSPGTLTFDPGQTSKQIVVLIDNDSIDEDNETVIIDLSNPINTSIVTATHTITIQDNDTAVVNFQMTSRTVAEGTNVNVNVVLDRMSAKLVTVPFTVGGSATGGGNDYTLQTASPLVFQPGETSKTITIDTHNNSPPNEPDETVVLDLQTPTTGGAQRGNANRFTLTITD